MIKYFKRPENLLLIVPLLFLGIERIWFRDSLLDFHLHDTMFVASRSVIFWIFLMLMAPMFMMHSFLRSKKWRGGRFCNVHVVITVLCILMTGICLILTQQEPIGRSFSVADLKKVNLRNELMGYCILGSVAIFVILQVLFLFYFIITIIKKRFVSRDQ
jgi:hypothetical protein